MTAEYCHPPNRQKIAPESGSCTAGTAKGEEKQEGSRWEGRKTTSWTDETEAARLRQSLDDADPKVGLTNRVPVVATSLMVVRRSTPLRIKMRSHLFPSDRMAPDRIRYPSDKPAWFRPV